MKVMTKYVVTWTEQHRAVVEVGSDDTWKVEGIALNMPSKDTYINVVELTTKRRIDRLDFNEQKEK